MNTIPVVPDDVNRHSTCMRQLQHTYSTEPNSKALPGMSSRDYSTNVALLSKLCARNGSDSDWHRFYENYKSMITRWCRHAGIDASELEDVFHEIMVKLMTSISSYDVRKGHRFRSWLKTVVLNTLTDRLRTAKPFPAPVGSADSVVHSVEAAPASVEELAEQLTDQSKPSAEILKRVRARVTEATWDAFVRRELLEEQVETIAASLGIKKASVYQSVSRVRKLVQDESQRWFDENPD